MSKFFTVYRRKRREARFWGNLLDGSKAPLYFSTNIDISAEDSKEEELATKKKEKAWEIFRFEEDSRFIFFFSYVFLCKPGM